MRARTLQSPTSASAASTSANRPSALPEGVDWRAADATDPHAAADAAKGASVVYQCLNAPYTKWPELFPAMTQAVLDGAAAAGAKLVFADNLYVYGPPDGPMAEDSRPPTPHTPPS